MVPLAYNISSITNDLKLHSQVSKARIGISAAILIAILCCGYKKIVKSFQDYPILLICVAFFGNYCIDLFSKYRQIDKVLQFFSFAQAMSRYLLCLRAIKN